MSTFEMGRKLMDLLRAPSLSVGDTVAELLQRAAAYQDSQPGFAAELRAAAAAQTRTQA